jgi:hypothetical protein
MFENRVLGRIFGQKKEEVAGGDNDVLRVVSKERFVLWVLAPVDRILEKTVL